ncbi:hypothetical protein HELRODRAFT_62270, partial [Helobdella robusta]|uniref:Alpha-mannosidase n=1 Tax=Helobdella robusta TaxID=6412 RepID=T1FWY2_HELRO
CDLGKPNMLNVHLVAHSHDDVGWLQTVDGYYYKTVQYILDTVNFELNSDPKKKFIYVEMAFFYRWWNELTDHMKQSIKKTVNRGQLEFILGGWSMNDEACTHYSSIIDQHTIGFKFLLDNFGKCGIPKIGWQIDPFGHSRELASISAQFGFDGLFLARIDYQDYQERIKTKTLEHMWFSSPTLGDQASMFTASLHRSTYTTPPGYCFECDDPPVRDDPMLDDYNGDHKVANFIDDAMEQAKYFTSNHIMWTMGSDFSYSNARINFKNIEKLIKLVNAKQANGSKINAMFSTPSCYLYALNKANLTYTSKNDDFFPYAHSGHTFWTGYFTSRPNLKGYERTANNILQVCKQLSAFAQLVDEHATEKKINFLKQSMGVLQHHDAVTGTSKQYVAYNYAKMLSTGIKECQVCYFSFQCSNLSHHSHFQFCNLMNVSSCKFTETNQNFAVVVYNPFSQMVGQYIKLPVTSNQLTVFDDKLKKLDVQFIPVSSETKKLAEFRGSTSQFQLVFHVHVPSLGYATYFVNMSNGWLFFIVTAYLKLTFDDNTGLLSMIENKERRIQIDARQSLMYYISSSGDNWKSGAYIFRPEGVAGNFSDVNLTIHELVSEAYQSFTSWASQVIRLYKGAKHFEIEWTVGPIPDDKGKEVVSSFETSIKSQNIFYTDANGRQMLKRVRDHRPTWNFENTEPVSGNYFPVSSRIYIQDSRQGIQLTVLNDRSQGGTSLREGHLELMIHRRNFNDDSLGVDEPLNEPGIDSKGIAARGLHYVLLDTIDSSVALHRSMAQQIYMAPYLSFLDLKKISLEQFWSGLKKRVNENVHILTLEDWNQGDVLLRLEHYYEKNEHGDLSKPAVISLKNLFAPLDIVSFEERTLGANQKLENVQRLRWNVQKYGKTKIDPKTWNVELKPMQIRTFLLKLSK